MRCTDPQVKIVPEELAIRGSSDVTHCGLNNTNDADDAQFKINDWTLQWYESNLRKTQHLAGTRSRCIIPVLWPMRARDLRGFTSSVPQPSIHTIN